MWKHRDPRDKRADLVPNCLGTKANTERLIAIGSDEVDADLGI